MKQSVRLIAVICSVLLLVSCAGLQLSESPIENYAKALGVWTDSAAQFKFYYVRADEETKAKWDKEFRPTLIKAKEILNLWKFHLDVGEATAGEMQQWKSLKNELIFYIATQMKGE